MNPNWGNVRQPPVGFNNPVGQVVGQPVMAMQQPFLNQQAHQFNNQGNFNVQGNFPPAQQNFNNQGFNNNPPNFNPGPNFNQNQFNNSFAPVSNMQQNSLPQNNMYQNQAHQNWQQNQYSFGFQQQAMVSIS